MPNNPHTPFNPYIAQRNAYNPHNPHNLTNQHAPNVPNMALQQNPQHPHAPPNNINMAPNYGMTQQQQQQQQQNQQLLRQRHHNRAISQPVLRTQLPPVPQNYETPGVDPELKTNEFGQQQGGQGGAAMRMMGGPNGHPNPNSNSNSNTNSNVNNSSSGSGNPTISTSSLSPPISDQDVNVMTGNLHSLYVYISFGLSMVIYFF